MHLWQFLPWLLVFPFAVAQVAIPVLIAIGKIRNRKRTALPHEETGNRIAAWVAGATIGQITGVSFAVSAIVAASMLWSFATDNADIAGKPPIFWAYLLAQPLPLICVFFGSTTGGLIGARFARKFPVLNAIVWGDIGATLGLLAGLLVLVMRQ